jgi:hypothetical protein
MLAEIFMLRMEAISRASKETEPADNSRFVPITLADFSLRARGPSMTHKGRPGA